LGKGEKIMYFAYFIENTTDSNIDNSGLFRRITDLEIDENEIYIDEEDCKEELENLLDVLENGDRLVVRSVIDLAEEAKDLLEVLELLQDKEVILLSIEESYLNGSGYYTAMKGFLDINRYYIEKKRKERYKEAKEKGIVGRPKMTTEIQNAIRLYKTREFTTSEIEQLS